MRITPPKDDEPIRLVCPPKCRYEVTRQHSDPDGKRHRYRAVLSTGLHPDGRRRQITTTHNSLSDARDWVAETRLAVRRGTYQAPDRTTVNALCDLWLASKRDVRPVTLTSYRWALARVRAHVGGMKVQELRRSDIDGFVNWLANEGGKNGNPVGHRTVTLTLGVVKAMLNYAVAEGMIPANPAATVRPPRRKDHDRKTTVWNPGELATFVAEADSHRWAAAWRLTASGLRRSEVCGMRWQDVDLDAGTVTVTQARVVNGSTVDTDAPKSRASARTVPVESMHPGTVALLKALRKQQAAHRLAAGPAWEESGLVLVDELGRGYRPDTFAREFRTLIGDAGLPAINLHAVRHSVATMLHGVGVAPAHAAALLGHSAEVHMATYVTPTQDGVEAAGAALANVLRSAQ